MYSALEFVSLPFVAGDQVVEGILFGSIFGFEVSHFFSVISSQLVNLFDQRVNFLIFQGQLSIQNLKLCIFFRDGRVQIV